MIRVVFAVSAVTPNNKKTTLHITGHAKTAPHGSDLVCAAVSTLAYTYSVCARKLQQEGKLRCKPTIVLDEGNAVITIEPKEDAQQEADTILSTIRCGCEMLSREYPEIIHIKTLNA